MSLDNWQARPPGHPLDHALYKDIVEQLPDAIIFADCNGVIRMWNQGAEAVFGFPAAEVIGSSLDIIIPERLRKAHWEGFRQAIASGRTRQPAQVRTTRSIHKLGRKLYVDLSFGVVKSAAGSVIGSVAVARDCTARHESDKALRSQIAGIEGKTT